MSYRILLQAVELVERTRIRDVHYEMVRILSRLRDVQAVEGDRRGRRERIVRLAQPVGARDCHAARLGVHARSEREKVRELRAHLEPGNVRDGVHDREGRARVVHDLVGEEAGEVRVVLAADGRLGGPGRHPFEEEDEGMQGLEVGEHGCV